MMLALLSAALAALLGFSAHRASICTVRAVAEVMSTRRAYMLASIGKSILWVLTITIPIVWLVPATHADMTGWGFSGVALLGGFVYGIGAALNGGCAFSTLNQLADGKLRMLVTFAGFCFGVLTDLALARTGRLPLPARAPVPLDVLSPWAIAIAAGLVIWGLFEIQRLWRTQPAGSRLKDLVLSKRYRLSTAAALMGLSNGVLYLLYGSWSYTGTVQQTIEGLVAMSAWPWPIRWALFAAMLAGMVFSTWQRQSFRLDWRPSLAWVRNLAGGALMGIGAVLVPGGNDVLVLHAIPSLSPHALPAYAAMLAGIATALITMRYVIGMEVRVECSGDVCTAEVLPRPPSARRSRMRSRARMR
jgi:hypothetical protein